MSLIRILKSLQTWVVRLLAIAHPAMPIPISSAVWLSDSPLCQSFFTVLFGPHEGRCRAAWHVREQPNLYLETSWCDWQTVVELVV